MDAARMLSSTTTSAAAPEDWIYPSHGRTTVLGGPGRDYVWRTTARARPTAAPAATRRAVRTNGDFKLRNCEQVRHFCAHGEDSKGNRLSPSGRPVSTSRRTR